MSETENTTGFRAPTPEELAPLFEGYRIEHLIATGGMGAVYKAVQTSLDREVAIKILPSEFGNDPEFSQNFTTEARAMAKLNHPNLIGVYDFGDAAGMLFIVMEYVAGKSLHDASHGQQIDPSEVIRIMTKVSLGMAHAHHHGILHRDIKPANILLNHQMEPKIGDFGLARPVDMQIREGEAIYGTPGYTAPEVLQPPFTVDQGADIFSLGVMIHELLTGMLPDQDPRSCSAITHCDPRFDLVVAKATQPRRELRYRNAAEIAEELQKIATTAGPRVLQTAMTTRVGLRAPSTATSGVGLRAPSTATSGVGLRAPTTVTSKVGLQGAAGMTSRVDVRSSRVALAAPAVNRSAAGRPAAGRGMSHRPMPMRPTLSSSSSGGGMFLFIVVIGVIAAMGFIFRAEIQQMLSPQPPKESSPAGTQPGEAPKEIKP